MPVSLINISKENEIEERSIYWNSIHDLYFVFALPERKNEIQKEGLFKEETYA